MIKKRIVIGITGATGFVYGIKILELLKNTDYETHLIVSNAADKTWTLECDITKDKLFSLADKSYRVDDIEAPISSGSFRTEGMIVAPCSVNTLARIANGICDNLVTRAADVTLKERRKLVLMVRETPLHLGHIRSMASVTEMGGIICPPVPSFYHKPATIDDIVTHSAARVLDLFGIEIKIPRWD